MRLTIELHTAIGEGDFVFETPAYRHWIYSVFLDQYPGREPLRVVSGQNRHCGLHDDWSMIQRSGDDMDGAAVQSNAFVKSALVRIQSGKSWKQ